MNTFKNLRLGARLGIAFGAILLLTVCVGLLAINRIGAVNAATADLATNWLPATRALGDARQGLNMQRLGENRYFLARTPEETAAALKRIDSAREETKAAWKRYIETVTTDEERKLADAITEGYARYVEAQKKALALAHDGGTNDAQARALFEGDGRVAFNDVLTAFNRDVEFQNKGANIAYGDSQGAYERTRWLVGGLLFAAVAIGALLAWLITRSITAPIRQAVALAETVARGDLRSRIQVTSRDETGQLLGALQRMNGELLRIVGSVRGNADSVAIASSQIAQGNADLSQRTEEQASNLQQTAASMEQLTATVKQNAETARQAVQLATTASGVAGQGGEVVGRVVATMEDISASSKKIADIIGVIDGIAFQTNILALNAAVEAARAGEQGRGFAVVAGEVRSLAQRSAEAAKEIKSLIGASVEKVETGSSLVGDAGRTMGEIVSQVRRVTDLINEISAASVEQTSGIGQIGDAVSQLDQVTQQNAALVEESAAAADSLQQQASQLAQAISFFTLDENKQPVAAAAPKAAPVKPAAANNKTAHRPAAGPKKAPASTAIETPADADWTTF